MPEVIDTGSMDDTDNEIAIVYRVYRKVLDGNDTVLRVFTTRGNAIGYLRTARCPLGAYVAMICVDYTESTWWCMGIIASK